MAHLESSGGEDQGGPPTLKIKWSANNQRSRVAGGSFMKLDAWVASRSKRTPTADADPRRRVFKEPKQRGRFRREREN